MAIEKEFEVVDYTSDLWEKADRKARSLPIFKNSHRGLKGNQIGCLGEAIAERWLNENGIVFNDETYCTSHDYRLPDRTTIDVKTKDRTVVPISRYDCSVPAYNETVQRPDYYIFVSLVRDKGYEDKEISCYRKGYIVGGIARKRFEGEITVWKGKETDPANGMTFWTTCKNIRISRLDSPESVLAYVRGESHAPVV